MKTSQQYIILLVIMNFAVLIYFAQAQTKSPRTTQIVRAQSIELVDSKGQVRALLNVEESGETVFRLRDAKGTIRVKIGASEDGSGLILLDNQTSPGIQALAKKSGSTITVKDKNGHKILRP